MREMMAITKALSDENRTRVLMSLRDGELCVCQIIELLNLAPSTVSKHLTVLHQAGLTEAHKEGRWMYYRLPGKDGSACSREAIQWLQANLPDDPQVVQDAKKLKAIRKMSKGDLCRRYKS